MVYVETIRVVLQDPKYVIAEHNDSLQVRHSLISWVGLVTLSLTAGLVLDKVDALQVQKLAKIIADEYETLKVESLIQKSTG